MKKSVLTAVIATILLCALVCAAVCVGSLVADPVVGTWMAEDDTVASYAVFEENNTGRFTIAIGGDYTSGLKTITFTWSAAEPKTSYTLLYADGTTDTAVFGKKRGSLTIGGVEYQELPSNLSVFAKKAIL